MPRGILPLTDRQLDGMEPVAVIHKMFAHEARERAQRIIRRADAAVEKLISQGYPPREAEKAAMVYWDDPAAVQPWPKSE